jgi:uncharacterized membrane protein YhaH (DUF805 family)
MVQALSTLFLPVGRGSRAEMLLAAFVMLAGEAILFSLGDWLGQAGALVLKALVVWIGLMVTIRRLHDLGFSAWWVLFGAAFLCMWGSLMLLSGLFFLGREVVVPGSTFHLVVLALVMLPAIGVALWLHLAPGQPFRNRYGLPTSGQPQLQSETDRPGDLDVGIAR